MNCGRSGCTAPATLVSQETLATPYCVEHFEERRQMPESSQLTAIPVDEWSLSIHPNRPHPDHVGCWCLGHFKGLRCPNCGWYEPKEVEASASS